MATAIWVVRERATAIHQTVPTRSGPHTLRIEPILGPAGDTHAVKLWLGPSSARVPASGNAVGAIWDLESQTLALPSGVTQLAGVAAEEYAPRMSVAELFHRISAFDRHGELLDLLYDPQLGKRVQFEATVGGGGERAGRWRVTVRARHDERGRGAWWLIEDVTSDHIAIRGAALESVGLREAHRRAGTRLAVVQLERASIAHWLTDPAPWIRWDYLFRPCDVFHPDDRAKLMELHDRVQAGFTASVTVRTLNYGGGYSQTSLLVYPYPGYSTQPLAIVEFMSADSEIPQLDAIFRPGEQASSGTPIGYDEQLRCKISGIMKRAITR
ncbi:GAF domain-containing protein [Nocardia sp. NPDC004722]